MDSCWIIGNSPQSPALYRARSTISTSRHRLSLDNGRVSAMRTRSPDFAEFSSSCAFTFFVCVTIFPYTGCGTRRSSATTTVFSILSLTTRPTRVFRMRRGFESVDAFAMSTILRVLLLPALRRRRFALRASRFALGQYRLETRDVLSDGSQPQRILQRLGRAAEPQPEPLFLELRDARFDVVGGHLADFLSSHRLLPPSPPRRHRAAGPRA